MEKVRKPALTYSRKAVDLFRHFLHFVDLLRQRDGNVGNGNTTMVIGKVKVLTKSTLLKEEGI